VESVLVDAVVVVLAKSSPHCTSLGAYSCDVGGALDKKSAMVEAIIVVRS
jgi:hypothetical protein